MMVSRPKLAYFITAPISIISLASFGGAIAVGVLSETEGPFEGYWPLEKTGERMTPFRDAARATSINPASLSLL